MHFQGEGLIFLYFLIFLTAKKDDKSSHRPILP